MSTTYDCVCPSPMLTASFHGEVSECAPHGSVSYELLGRPNGPGVRPGASSLMLRESAEFWMFDCRVLGTRKGHTPSTSQGPREGCAD